MTKDKQIIINGVDVSGCEHFCREVCCEVGFGKDASCKLFEDCLYKKYKRKEQECEELKDKLNCCFCNQYVELNNIETQRKCVEVTECFRRQLDQLKQTLTEIKEIAEEYQKEYIVNNGVVLLCNQILQKISEVE